MKHLSLGAYSQYSKDENSITKEDNFFIDIRELDLFKSTFNNFVSELKQEDINDEDVTPILYKNDYLLLDEVIKKEAFRYLKDVINNFLFIEFFSLYTKKEQSDYYITELLKLELSENKLFLKTLSFKI